jgi:hypothetical protein
MISVSVSLALLMLIRDLGPSSARVNGNILILPQSLSITNDYMQILHDLVRIKNDIFSTWINLIVVIFGCQFRRQREGVVLNGSSACAARMLRTSP